MFVGLSGASPHFSWSIPVPWHSPGGRQSLLLPAIVPDLGILQSSAIPWKEQSPGGGRCTTDVPGLPETEGMGRQGWPIPELC